MAALKAAGHPDVERVAAGSQGANARPLLGTSQLDEWLVPKATTGPTMPTNAALRIARAALVEVKESDGDGQPFVAAPQEPAQEEAGSVLKRAGDNWTACYGGRTTSLRHTKGLVDIAHLLKAPGQEIHVLDLAGAGVVETAADDTIDKTAMAQYRARIGDLRSELEEATDNADIGRAERAREELDALIEQLSSASGLGGRVRRTTGTAARARSTVTKRVRGTIKKLLKSHPELGRHLDSAISTGAYCKYHPEQPVAWRL